MTVLVASSVKFGKGKAMGRVVHGNTIAQAKLQTGDVLLPCTPKLCPDPPPPVYLLPGGGEGGPCGGCKPALPLQEGQTPAWHLLLEQRFAPSYVALQKEHDIATLVCPGPSVLKLDKETYNFMSDHTDAWGINDVSHFEKLKFFAFHIEPSDGTKLFHGHTWNYQPEFHANANVVCETDCGNVLSSIGGTYKKFWSYARACYGDCSMFLDGAKVTEYSALGKPDVLCPMGNSMNRVIDILVKMQYKQILIAGCDFTPLHIGTSERHGDTVHPSMTYGSGAMAV